MPVAGGDHISSGFSEICSRPEGAEGWYDARQKRIVELASPDGAVIQGTGKPDYSTLIHEINQNSELGLSDYQKKIADYVMTSLSEVGRFADSDILFGDKRENAAVHSAHCMNRLDNLFLRANVVQDEAALAMRTRVARTLLVHDWEEIFGEPETMDSRANKGSDTSGKTHDISVVTDESTDRLIGRYAVTLAAIEALSDNKEGFLQKIRQDRAVIQEMMKTEDEQGIRNYLGHQLAGLRKEGLGKTQETDITQMMDWVKLAIPERDAERNFEYYLYKGVDHVEGTRHLMKFADRVQPVKPVVANEGITWLQPVGKPVIERKKAPHTFSDTDGSYAFNTTPVDSLKLCAAFNYNEKEVGRLFHHANGEPFKLVLAKHHALDIYRALIDHLDSRPPVFRRIDGKSYKQEHGAGAFKTLKDAVDAGHPDHQYQSLFTAFKDQAQHSPENELRDIESRARVRALYKTAMEGIADGSFIPQKDVTLLFWDKNLVDAGKKALPGYERYERLVSKALAKDSRVDASSIKDFKEFQQQLQTQLLR